jgi:hypothetical protein
MLTTSTGCSTSGIWLTRSFSAPAGPGHQPMMITTIAIGA